MFEEVFKSVLSDYTKDEALRDKLWLEIKTNYCSSKRHYHNLIHLEHLVCELLPIRNKIKDWHLLIFSIAYHDIFYNTNKQDNEEQSAELACNRLYELNIEKERRERCKQQILATKKHEFADPDTNYFTDADLSILGSDEENYKTYAEQIRNEYEQYPNFLYNPGRKKVLQHFLDMDSIFKTEYFKEKYEKKARANILFELNNLIKTS